MAWEDTNRSHIELLIENGDWNAAFAALNAYIDKNGLDSWAKNWLKLVEDKLGK